MPRPKLCKNINSNPNTTFYTPRAVPLHSLEIIELDLEEWETLRLKHQEKLNQTDAAEKMHTSQSTFQRILASAQEKISLAIVQGKAIKINKNLDK